MDPPKTCANQLLVLYCEGNIMLKYFSFFDSASLPDGNNDEQKNENNSRL